jgi:hypothetical protein
MTRYSDAAAARDRARALGENAQRHLRADADRFLRPDWARFLRPDWERYVEPAFVPFYRAQFEAKANFNPNQPRVPRGSPDGGQWTAEGAQTARARPARVRLASSEKPDLGRAARQAIAVELAQRLIEAYRSENFLNDLFGGRRGTVTVTAIGNTEIFGSNSSSPTYSRVDRADADRLRARYLGSEGSLPRPGQMPGNAFYHAETTVLLRAARQNGGTLSGRTIEIFADRPMCDNCDAILPFVGKELGNPTVTFVAPNGARKTMKDGKWIDEGSK